MNEPIADLPAPPAAAVARRRPRRGNAARLFGYDVFISFALGPPPRGTQGYASDLARRLRERDFTVFFSEDEAPPGEQLDSALRTALYRARILVVVANRETLEAPRWVRMEVEEFRRRHPTRPVIPISVGGALQDQAVAQAVQEWLDFRDKIWLDESSENIEHGIASEILVERLALAPTRFKSNVAWRWVVRGVVAVLALLSIGLAVSTKYAIDSAERARAELRRAVSVRLIAESQAMLTGTRDEGDERAMLQMIAAHRLAPGPVVDGGLLGGLLHRRSLQRVMPSLGPMAGVRFSADGRELVSAERDHRAVGGSIGVGNDLRRWDVRTGQPIGQPIHLDRSFGAVDFTLDASRMVAVHGGASIHVWDARTGAPIFGPLKGDNWLAESVAFSPDGRRVVAGYQDGTLHEWNADTGERLGPAIHAHQGSISSIAFTVDGRRFATGGHRPGVRLWDGVAFRPLAAVAEGDGDLIYTLALSPDGTRFVTGGGEPDLRIWDVATGKTIGDPLRGHVAGVTTVAFGPDGRTIASGSFDGTVRIWDADTGRPIGDALTGHRGSVNRVAFNPEGTLVVSGGDDGGIRLWSAKPGRTLGVPVPGEAWTASSLAFSPDGRRIVVGNSVGGTLRLVNSSTGAVILERFGDHQNMVTSVAFTPDGKRIVSGSTDGTVRVWDAESGKAVRPPLEDHGGVVTRVAISRDGTRIVASGHTVPSRQRPTRSVVRLWDASSGDRIPLRWDAGDAGVSVFAFGADAHHLLVRDKDGPLKVIDAESGQALGPVFDGPGVGTTNALFSPDGLRVAAGGGDGVRLWDARTGKPIGRILTEHKGAVSSVAFSPDGAFIVSGSRDGTLRIWDARTSQPIGGALEGHDKDVTGVAFSPDGLRLVSVSEDGTLRSWPAPRAWPEVLCAKLNRNMTRREWREWISREIEYARQCADLPIPPDPQDRRASR